MDLKKMAVEVHKTALSKGWWDDLSCDHRKNIIVYASKLLLIHSELREAYIELRATNVTVWYDPTTENKPEGALVELVDAVIRCMDLIEKIGDGEEKYHSTCNYDNRLSLYSPSSYERFINECHGWVAHTAESLRRGNIDKVSTLLTYLISFIRSRAFESDKQFEQVFNLKAEYNKTRTVRHGGKVF